jgi:hypothetical protein
MKRFIERLLQKIKNWCKDSFENPHDYSDGSGPVIIEE